MGQQSSNALNIPYVTLEAARTGQGFQNGGDRWAKWRHEAQGGIKQADLHIALKPNDITYLKQLLGPDAPVTLMAPFIDTALPDPLPEVSLPGDWQSDVPVMITVGMMRPGKKMINFEILAKALTPLKNLRWNLVIIGDGPEHAKVCHQFSGFDQRRLCFTGEIPREDVLAHMAKSVLFVWPGWQEPIGMVYLEAQLSGLPVAALDSMGVSLSVHHGKTGLLSCEDKP